MWTPKRFGRLLLSIRLGEELSQVAFAKELGISTQNLCDIEKGRSRVRPTRASAWAKKLGYDELQFITLSLQGELDESGLGRYQVNVVKSAKRRASPRPKPKTGRKTA